MAGVLPVPSVQLESTVDQLPSHWHDQRRVFIFYPPLSFNFSLLQTFWMTRTATTSSSAHAELISSSLCENVFWLI